MSLSCSPYIIIGILELAGLEVVKCLVNLICRHNPFTSRLFLYTLNRKIASLGGQDRVIMAEERIAPLVFMTNGPCWTMDSLMGFPAIKRNLHKRHMCRQCTENQDLHFSSVLTLGLVKRNPDLMPCAEARKVFSPETPGQYTGACKKARLLPFSLLTANLLHCQWLHELYCRFPRPKPALVCPWCLQSCQPR